MDGARERREGGSEQRREGATERVSGAREERGRKGDKEEGKLQGRYHEEDTDQYTVYSAQNNTTRPLPLRLWYYKYQIVNGYINSVL